ncbi:MAG TPA: hypothetical protein VLV54_13320 [Thermoanaerobaculia bacterium]|nr:hypothetical protein [Thermoanaerobaculia bacterium]
MAALARFPAFLTLLILVAGMAAAPTANLKRKDSFSMNRAAESYVKLVLAVGQHDADYVDAYYGPPEWRAEAEAHKRPLPEIRAEAEALIGDVEKHAPGQQGDEIERLRHAYLLRQLQSMVARIDLVAGKKMTFDQESKALYDAVAPTYGAAHFQQILDRLDKLLPGDGSLPARVETFRQRFVIPRDRLDAVFQAAVAECRQRTAQHIKLPADESFVVEYVTNKSWSGYNWYKGGFHSLIQVNTDLPIFIDRAVDLACHEGYPGHHVYNALLEQHLVRGRGWPEFSVYALFSPQSLIAEGTANFGIDVAFPGAERTAFEREKLYPLAGLDPTTAARYAEVRDLLQQLGYAGNEAARGFLDGKITRPDAEAWLVRYGLMSPDRAAQRVRFIEQYRSYVINYNLGQDLVREYIEKRGGTADHPQQRWDEFAKLISSPRLPSGLR